LVAILKQTMNIEDYSYHDSTILRVSENTEEKTLDLLLDFPIDWENNIFKNKILRFKNVIFYSVDEIPFKGQPSIMEITNLGQITKTFGTGRNQIETSRNKIEIHTNAGKRIIEFSECELINT
jgi:hypothetical protein